MEEREREDGGQEEEEEEVVVMGEGERATTHTQSSRAAAAAVGTPAWQTTATPGPGLRDGRRVQGRPRVRRRGIRATAA